ncbi:MAG: DUF2721 domain-containing protein [Cytophagaceae bacterium]
MKVFDQLYELSITTPALLFPTVSLLLLAYTNRYNAVSVRIRNLYATYKDEPSDVVLRQIGILKKRLSLIRNMQLFGIGSMFFAAFTMTLIYFNYIIWAELTFIIALLGILISLTFCAVEVFFSNKALFILMEDIEDKLK